MSTGNRYKWNDRNDTNGVEGKFAVYISFAVDTDIEDRLQDTQKKVIALEKKIKRIRKDRDSETDESKRKNLNNSYLINESEYNSTKAEVKKLEELEKIARHNSDTEYRITRLKDIYSRKEALCVEIIRNGLEDGKLISASTRIDEDIYRLEEYGVYMTVPCYDELARHIKEIYFDLKVHEQENIDNNVPEGVIRRFIELCAVEIMEPDRLKDTDKKNTLYYVDVATVAEWYQDSSLKRYSLTEIKEALSIYGYTKTNRGRNDLTVMDSVTKKARKVIAFDKGRMDAVIKMINSGGNNE